MSIYDSYREFQRQESFALEVLTMRRAFDLSGLPQSANAEEPLAVSTAEKSTDVKGGGEDEIEMERRLR